MSRDRFEKLTIRQRECLRLYHQRYRVKEIARELGISENTVSGYLTEATALLGVGGRPAAAAALVAHEGQDVANLAFSSMPSDHRNTGGRFSVGDTTPLPAADEPDRRSVAARSEPRHAPPDTARMPAWMMWLPLRNGDGNDLTVAQRFVLLGLVTFLLVAGFGLFAFFIRTVSELAGAIGH